MYPFTCARAVRAAPAVTLSRAKEGSQRHKTVKETPRPETQEARGRGGIPRQDPCRGSLRSPGKSLAGATCLTPTERASLEPRGTNAISHIGTKAREAPPWWHADICQDHKHTRSNEDQKTTPPAGSVPRRSTRPPASALPGTTAAPWQDPCRAPGKALAEGVSGAIARPASTKTPRRPQAAASSTSWAGTCVATSGLYTNSASTCVVACRSL